MAPTDPNQDQPLEAVVVRPREAIWNTRDIAHSQKNMKSYVELHLVEVIIFGLFIIVFMNSYSHVFEYRTHLVDNEISALFMDPSFYGNENDDAAIKFENILSIDHFWTYLKSVVCEKLYNTPIAHELDDKVISENKFLYKPRIRQVRISDDKCGIRKHFNSLFKKCYASYSIDDEDRSSFGLENGTAWTYTENSGVAYSTVIANYGAGGYYFDFPENKVKAIDFLEHLKKNNWITHNTRAIFIDFAIYNYNLETISLINLVFEFPPGGGIVPASSFQTIELYNYVLTNSTIIMTGMLITVCFLIYFTLEEIFEIHYHRLRYFTIFWNWIDLSIILLGWNCVQMSVTIYLIEPTPKLEEIYRRSKGTVYYHFVLVRHIHITEIMGYLFFLISVKLFKYSDASKTLSVIYMSLGRRCVLKITLTPLDLVYMNMINMQYATIVKIVGFLPKFINGDIFFMCFKTILRYLVITNIIMVTYVTYGYCMYGSQVYVFSTLKRCYISATKILMRDFDFFLVSSDSSSIVFIFYCCFTVFGLSGLLMAMVFHTYFEVDVETLLDGRKQYLIDLVAIHIDNILEKMNFNKYVDRRREERRQNELDKYFSYKDVYRTLKRSNFSDSETKAILDNHGIEPQNTVHEDEAEYMFRDILNKSDDRVEILENSVKEANKKLDVVMKNVNSVKIKKPPTSE